MNDVITQNSSIATAQDSRASTSNVIAHVKAVQEIMQSVMKENVHYGVIPGAGDKKTLLKPGAELLCMTFRIADEYQITDLSKDGAVRYQVKCIGIHQTTGATLGSGLGEGSTDEEKYKWRKAVCDIEFDKTPENLRRVKYGRKSGGHYEVQQVRTEPADLANTVLKMACKRAKIAMVLNVTAASDMFSQDLEDLDAELVRHLAEDEKEAHVAMIRESWIAKLEEATTEDQWRTITRDAKKDFQTYRDVDGLKQFSAAATARAAVIKGQANA